MYNLIGGVYDSREFARGIDDKNYKTLSSAISTGLDWFNKRTRREGIFIFQNHLIRYPKLGKTKNMNRMFTVEIWKGTWDSDISTNDHIGSIVSRKLIGK